MNMFIGIFHLLPPDFKCRIAFIFFRGFWLLPLEMRWNRLFYLRWLSVVHGTNGNHFYHFVACCAKVTLTTGAREAITAISTEVSFRKLISAVLTGDDFWFLVVHIRFSCSDA